MKSPRLLFIGMFLALAAGIHAQSTAQPASARYPTSRASGSIVTTLTTGGYEFNLIHPNNFTNVLVNPVGTVILPTVTKSQTTIPIGPVVPTVQPLSFKATFTLKNSTFEAQTFSFPWSYWATNKIVFTAYDTNDAVVWMSVPIPVDVPPLATPTTLTLGAGKSWSQTVTVPLNPGGETLADGIYRLEGTLTGTPAFSANAAFKVNNLYSGPIVIDPLAK
jgi:hypothetical protein